MTAKPMYSCTSEFKLEIHSERTDEDEKDAEEAEAGREATDFAPKPI